MWIRNTDTNKWSLSNDSLDKTTYDSLKQDLLNLRLYSKTLSGSTYLPINNLDNIYDILSYQKNENWFVSSLGSPYSSTPIPLLYETPITATSSDEYFNKYLPEYGLTLKNLFTPTKLINDSIKNYIAVDVATTEMLTNLGQVVVNLTIDGIRLVDGHRVLVKDQITYVTLPISTDPSTYFTGNYYSYSSTATAVTYYFYDNTNGIYLYKNNALIRANDLDVYSDVIRYSIVAKLGLINKDLQYHLSRLLSGYYPLVSEGDPIEFIEKHNWVLRNRVDYDNVLDINYHDILKHDNQTIIFNSYTYSIPQRTLGVGDFGIIINNQGNNPFTGVTVSNIITNKFKYNLKSIDQSDNYYWICGDNGTLLKVSKIDFSIVEIDLGTINNLTSISFYNNLRGMLVGEFNTIFYTLDGGYNWIQLEIPEFDALTYNVVLFNQLNIAYIGGDNGVFMELTYSSNDWVVYKRTIIKTLDDEDNYLLVEDINDLCYATFSSTWGLTYSSSGGAGILDYKEILFITTNNNNLVLFDINNYIPEYDFTYLDLGQVGDCISISNTPGTSQIYLATDTSVNQFDLNQFSLVATFSNLLTTTFSTYTNIFNSSVNKIVDYNSQELLSAGNNGLLDFYVYGQSFQELDPTFGDNLKSKMLFLDYDIASKLNFFDSAQNYRLPNSTTFSAATFSISNIGTETNWIDYYLDAEKTFEYYSYLGSQNVVQFSATFSNIATSSVISLTASNITTSYNDIINLAPNITSLTQSRYIAGLTAISAPANFYNLYLYRYLMVVGVSASSNYSIGDVLQLSNPNVLTSNFVINNIKTLSGHKYLYLYTDFNETIVKQFAGSTYSTTITNLNKFYSLSELYSNFNSHPIGYGYQLDIVNPTYSIVEISPLFNNKTAYYNMQANINLNSGTQSMLYEQTFLDFGYKPTYNLYSYLNNINSSSFGLGKQFLALPEYSSIPVGGLTPTTVFIEYNFITNLIIFGSSFNIEWNSLMLNTFVDVTVYQTTNTTTQRLLIINKTANDDGTYTIAFHNKIDIILNTPITSVDILSRNNIQQISDDLQLLNDIQRSSITKNVQLSYTFDNLDNDIDFKFPTDSYAKALLSDVDIKQNLSAILYTDYKGELSMNVTKLDRQFQIPSIATGDFGGYLQIICSQKHGLQIGEGFVFGLTGGVGTSNQLNPQYAGFTTVTFVVDDYSFVTSTLFGNVKSTDPGYVIYTNKDPFFNYEPCDIFDLGIDLGTKIAVEIKPQNYELNGYVYSLTNLDLTKFKYQLTDGLSIDDINNKYPWILDAEISDAVIGQNSDGLVWYEGTWNSGRWYGGTWLSGSWISGDWMQGTWKSVKVTYTLLNAKVYNYLSNDTYSKWYNGRWYDGLWSAGSWYNGRRYGGTWSSGVWYNGIWNDGTWNDGHFVGGIWVLGTWNSGTFSTDNKPAYWLDGQWYGGDFENGIWYDGSFGQANGSISRFGTNASNSRTAIWHSGQWLSGDFYSTLNTDSNGNIIVSDIHRYSIWYTGSWNTGNWWGGIAYNIDFRAGTWQGGILEDIQIIGINTSNNTIQLNGEFHFNIGDQIWVIDNNIGNTYSVIGSNSLPNKFRIADVFYGSGQTELIIDYNLSLFGVINVSNINTGLRVVSKFTKSTWNSGIWTNGIFDGGKFNGGIWYDGLFNGTWGN